jgi:hypothetical protein
MILEVTVRLPDTAGARTKWRELKPKPDPFVYFNLFGNFVIQIIIRPNFSMLNNAPGRKL